jgi:hypothetical protein
MEQQTLASQVPPVAPPQNPVQPQVATPPPAQPQPSAAPVQKKSHVWLWILGGCFTILVIIMAVVVVLGWLGARKVKREMEKYQPNIEGIKDNIDKMSKEGEEWEKKSKEFRESMPNPEDLEKQLPMPANN